MSDSPFAAAPLDPREKPVLESILLIRDKLLLLKQDKSTYVKSQDVIPLYDQVIEQVGKLNSIREGGHKQLELNRGQSHSCLLPCPSAVTVGLTTLTY
jgi:hypothetical protein